MGHLAKTEVGRRIIQGLEEIVADERSTPKQRRDAERKLAEWKAAREA